MADEIEFADDCPCTDPCPLTLMFGITALVGFVVDWSAEFSALMAAEMLIATIGSAATLVWIAFGVLLQGAYRRHYRAANALFAVSLALCAVEMLL